MDLETLKEEVRARADVVDIIGRVVKLRKASGAWKGLCPFHQEKTPSFNVNPRRQTYHCFGCGVGGDVFKFVMEYEHLDFMGALEKLADQTGVPFELDGSRGSGNLKRRLLDLHERAAAYYREALTSGPEGDAARNYLASRELAADTPENFRLGYAPDSFNTFLALARDWGFSDQEIEASGMVGVSDRPGDRDKYYDRFRERLMFPIRDEQGRVIGFSGRAIPPSEAKAKYLNSPETLLFKKSRVLYGIDKARRAMTEKRRAVLCEGQLDVIRCHESGIVEAVAAQGTAITGEHAGILKRYSDEVVLLLDADSAGVKAALRSAEALLGAGLTARVASLPEGEDPDDLVRKHGGAKLREIVEAADPFVVFQIRTLVAREGEITETSRLRVARAVMETISLVGEAVHREELIRQAAGALGMREEALRQDLKPAAAVRAALAAPSGRTGGGFGGARTVRAPRPALPPPDAYPPSEKLLLELLLANPEGIATARELLRPRHLRHPDCVDMLEALYAVEAFTLEAVHDAARQHPAGEKLIALDHQSRLRIGGEMGTPGEALVELIVRLRREQLAREKKRVQEASRAAEAGRRTELEPDIWRISMHETQLKECGMLKDWNRARMLLGLIDMQEEEEEEEGDSEDESPK